MIWAGVPHPERPDPAPVPEVTERFPATSNQRTCWDMAIKANLGSALHAAFSRRIVGRISDSAIESALQALTDRHEIFRTRFHLQADGQLVQEVLRKATLKPVHVDLRHLPQDRRESEHDRLARAAACEPFPFTDSQSPAPLVRVLLVRMAHDLAFMHIVFHQLVVDGWSVELVVDEFARLAAAHDAGRALDLPEPDLQFGDYARWQQDLLADPAMAAERDFWRGKLADAAHFTVPADRPDAPRDGHGQIRSILLPPAVSQAFDALARAHSHTAVSLGSATAAAALHRLSGEAEVVFGTQVAGRDDPAAEAIIGPVFNTTLIRHSLREGESFLSYADRLRETALDALQHGVLPFAEVASAMPNPAQAAAIADYRINLVVQRCNISSGSVDAKVYGAFTIDTAPSVSTGTVWDLSLFMVAREEGWRISCEGASARYDAPTIDRLLATWRSIIEAAIADPDAPLAKIAGLAPSGPERTVRNPRVEELRKRITALQPKGDGVPVIALNSSSVLYPVARAIGSDHPFYDIQFCPSPVRMALPERHFADHARDAVEMIRLARPHGPYVLFGLCIFGAIALEAARILQEEGEEVPLVILNDTYRPGYRERMGPFDRRLRRWQVSWRTFGALRKRFRAGEISGAEWIDNYRIARMLGLSRLLGKLGLVSTAEVRDVMQDNNRWFPEEVLLPSQGRYAMRPYSGRVILFRSMAMREGRLFPRDFGWKGYVDGPFLIADCPGTHDTMFRAEGAAVIGDVVLRALAEVAALARLLGDTRF